MIVIPETFIYKIIFENLDYLIVDDIDKTFDNIKEASILIHNYIQYDIIINENSLFSYFTDVHATTIGKLIQATFGVGDVILGTITSGSISSFSTTFLTSIVGGNTVASLTVGLGPLLLLIISYAIYKKFKTDEILNVSRMIKLLNRLSKILNFKINENINTEFKNLLTNRCSLITSKESKINCAVYGYIKFLNTFVLVDLINNYIKFLKNNNEDITNIKSFNQLATFKSQSNRNISNLMNSFYLTYITFLSNIKINKFIISDSFSLLNKTTQTALKKVS